MEKVSNAIQMAIHTSVNLNMGEHMVKEYTLGRTEKYTMANGTRVLSKAMVSGKEFLKTHILESGKIQKHMVTECTPGLTEIVMKDSGICVSSTAKEQTHSQMVRATTVNTQTENLMARESTPGRMALITLAILCVVSSTGKVNGRAPKTTSSAIHMRETIRTTSSMEKEYIPGRAATYTRVTTTKMRDMATAKCCGLTDLFTRVSGSKEFKMAWEELFFQTANLRKVFLKTTFISIL